MDESQPKTLYVGNLDASVSEDLLIALFSQMGTVKSCKIIREPGNDPYAFIEYTTYQAATTALTAMNKRLFLDKEIKVSSAASLIFWVVFSNDFCFDRLIGPPVPVISLKQTSVHIIISLWAT